MYIMGNRSISNTQYHKPIRGIGFQKLLKKHFQFYFIDEYKTNKCCHTGQNESLMTLKRVPNPRPFRRERDPIVIRHGLLRCTNQNYQETISNTFGFQYRLYDRDLISIIRSLNDDGIVPEWFQSTRQHRRRRER
ncbi:hypothetical protein BDF21DRAFT_422985 [Thamnidium elegans]|nr:hypothetical protein BDF21DRAFT_422985 [Thamnidium elegans]